MEAWRLQSNCMLFSTPPRLHASTPLGPMPMNIGIAAQISPGLEGGIDQFLMALIRGLTAGPGHEDRYQIVGLDHARAFLRDWAGPNGNVLARPPAPIGVLERGKRALGPVRRPAGKILRAASGLLGREIPPFEPGLGESDGYFESLSLDALHISYVSHYERTRVPTVLTIHDLQHRHLPQLFAADQLAWRERAYPEAMAHASLVVTDCEWGREDIIRQYGIDPRKVRTVMLASPIGGYGDPTPLDCHTLRRRLGLPASFALYPALTYGHKNHVRLLEAIAHLRDVHGVKIHLVCPGQLKLHWPVIRKAWHKLGLTDQVRFPGFLPAGELRALYRMARLAVFPSLIEGAGLPVLEAMSEGVPLAASDIPAVREYAGDAALLFDPYSVAHIVGVLLEIWEDDDRLRDLADRGRRRSAQFSIERMAREYRALYHEAAGSASGHASVLTSEAVC